MSRHSGYSFDFMNVQMDRHRLAPPTKSATLRVNHALEQALVTRKLNCASRAGFMNSVPPEVFLVVLRYLDQSDLASLALSCKVVHSLAQGSLYHHISLRNDKVALQLIRTHRLGQEDLLQCVTRETKSLETGHIGKVKLITILKSCSSQLKHLSIDCRLLTRQDQLEVCDCLIASRFALKSLNLRSAQPEVLEALSADLRAAG